MRAAERCVDVPAPRQLGTPKPPFKTALQLMLATFAAQATLLTLSPLVPEVASEFNVSISTVGQLRSISGLIAGLAAVAIAVRPPQTSLRRIILGGLVALALGTVASAVAPSYPLLALAQIPIGIGLAASLGGALAASDRWAPAGGGSRLLSWALLGQPIAWVVGMPLVGLVGEIDWRAAWIVPLGATAVAAAFLLPRRGDEGCEPPLPLSLLRSDRPLRRWLIGEIFALSAWAGTLIYCGALFIESYDVSVKTAGFILGGIAIAYLPGNALFRRWVDTAARPLLVGLALALAALAVPFGAFRPSVAVSFVLVAGTAFFSGGRTIAGSALGLAVGGERKMGAMSLRTAALQFGYLIGGALGGLALDLGGYAATGICFGALFLTSAFIHGPEPRTTD